MKTLSVNKRDDNKVSMVFEIEENEYAPFLKEASNALQKTRPIKGYRAGKAPLAVAKKVYGETLFSTAGNRAIGTYYEKACVENNFSPITEPKFVVVRADEKGMEVMAQFENYPEIESAEYKGIKVTRYVKTCSEADIDEAIDNYMKNHLWVHEVPREAQMGDIVEVKFRGTSEGKGFPYDHSDKSRFTLGSGQLFTGLDEALVGHVAGDHLEITLTMPENFHRQNIAGMTVDLQVDLVGVWARDLLECTDDYVKENVKVGNCNNVSEFREYQRKTLQERYDSRSNYLFRQSLDIAIGSVLDCEVPESMVQVSLNRFKETLRATAASEGMTPEQALAKDGSNMEEFIEKCRPYAIEKVKTSLLLDYVIRTENLTVEPDELSAGIASRAREYNKTVDEIKSNSNIIEDIYEKLLNEKAEKIIKDNVVEVIENVDVLPEKIR